MSVCQKYLCINDIYYFVPGICPHMPGYIYLKKKAPHGSEAFKAIQFRDYRSLLEGIAFGKLPTRGVGSGVGS